MLFRRQGTLAQRVAAMRPVSNLRLRAKACIDSRVGVPVCLGVRVAVFFLALMGRMKSASWTELGSASFLCLGPKPPGPGVGNNFPLILGGGGGSGGGEGKAHERVTEGLKQHLLGRADCT